ncbi:hypothetical protein [Agromyces sp. NPDC049794]|uniref:hypothetical protein n=1 Tax=unclassified Agromyces TaxID=2639701 RepID=UPI0033C7B178
MRFALAIVAFVAAAVMIGFGIAQRTVYLDPDRVTLTSQFEEESPYVVVHPDALGAYPGKQTLTVSGSETVFLAYGRTSDIESWLGAEPHVAVHYDAQTEEFTSEVVTGGSEADSPPATGTPTPTPTPAPAPAEGATETADPAVSPAGSDLWLDELTEERSLTTTIDVPDDIAVLLASDGTAPAPTDLAISWPLDNSTPLAGPLIAGGALVFLIGLILLFTGFLHHRRSRGPRRNLPKGPRGRLPSAPKPSTRQGLTGSNRRAIGRARRIALVPLIAVPALALSACSADYWPSFDQTASSTAPATPSTPPATDAPVEEDEEEMEPAVTVPQMERIMRRVAVFAKETDDARDATAIAERFTGPALEARVANYTIRGTLPDHPAPVAVPASPLTLTLPQQVAGWPASGRTVLTIAQNSDPTIAPTALVLQQVTPRDNYKIVYAMSLAPDADVPEVAPASIGAPLISPEFKGLVLPPGEVAAAYADLLLLGDASASYELFDAEGDVLREQLGLTGQQATRDSLQGKEAAIAFSNAVGDSPTIAMATNDSGALVSVSIEQTEQVTPTNGGTIGFEAGAPGAALSGFTDKSAKGVQRVIGVQLLFYVPSVGSDEQIRLLGWSEGLIGASEVP